MTEKTPEVTPGNDLDIRVKGFNEKMIPLLKEFELGLGATPFITPDGRIGSRPSLLDDKQKKTPAPETVSGDNSQTDAPDEAPVEATDEEVTEEPLNEA